MNREPDIPSDSYQRLFRAIPDPCAALAANPPHFTYVGVNDALERISLFSRERLVGRGFFEVLKENTDPRSQVMVGKLRESFERVVREGVVDSVGAYRYDIRRSNSDEFLERWWSPKNIPVFDDDGNVIFILHRVEDVTDIISRIRPSFASSEDGGDQADALKRVIVVDEDDDFRGYLARVCETQWRVDALSDAEDALDLARQVGPDLIAASATLPDCSAFELLERLRHDRTLAAIPVVLLTGRADESVRQRALESRADDVIGTGAMAREIIARLQAQISAADVRKMYEETSRRRFYELFMQAPAFICVQEGPELHYVLSNPAYRKMVGNRRVQGRPVREVFPEPEMAPFIEILERVYRTGESHYGEETPVELRDPENGLKEQIYITFAYLPTRDLEGNIDGIATFGFDVTELVIARQTMHEQTEALRKESRLKDEFLAMLGHELRNPLAPIVTAAELLQMQDEAPDADMVQWAAGLIGRQSGQMTELLDDLLDVARISQGRITLQRSPCSLDEIVSMAVETVRPMIDEREQHFVQTLPPDEVTIDIDRTRIAQVLSNLLHNASKYTPEGGEISLRAAVDGDELHLAVEDTGIGIGPNLLPYVFDLFRQADKSLDRSEGGMGLGLTLVRRLVEMHGGCVHAFSDGPSKGSCFEVVLPVVVDADVSHSENRTR